MKKKILIEGMTCQHCVKHVEEALKELAGVQSVTVDLPGKVATLKLSQEVADEKLKAIIEDLGYEVTIIE
ncbi:MAG TPA: heavy metal transport/detoxification protein [Firmicutes bacterium]|jgi:copper ion binding protein|nr:heavy metal transport/detoxification protein [Bacillota bacterium]HBT17331.1 heavy metal transport/detoxification protein [Bacillota bacterium]